MTFDDTIGKARAMKSEPCNHCENWIAIDEDDNETCLMCVVEELRDQLIEAKDLNTQAGFEILKLKNEVRRLREHNRILANRDEAMMLLDDFIRVYGPVAADQLITRHWKCPSCNAITEPTDVTPVSGEGADQ